MRQQPCDEGEGEGAERAGAQGAGQGRAEHTGEHGDEPGRSPAHEGTVPRGPGSPAGVATATTNRVI